MEFILIVVPILTFIYFYFSFKLVKKYKKKRKYIILELILASLYIVSFLFLLIGFSLNDAPYNIAIDPLDRGYSPFGEQHILTLVVFYIFFIISVVLLGIKGRKQPPLLFVLELVFLVFGIVISTTILMQVLIETTHDGSDNNLSPLFAITPLMSIIISLLLSVKIIYEEATVSLDRHYKNKTLNYLNTALSKSQNKPLWVIALLIPVFVIITLVLTLLGQDTDSMVKVFTETATWHFSQQTHPPYLDHQGHYLCTVAVCGDPKVVKPLRIGHRHGNEIIVNRQLLIANAYEEMIQDYSPRFHRIIRTFYDKYGYPFSKHITTPLQSNIIYLLMKPLEWLFLLKLYLFCLNPEAKIKKQYT